MIGSISGQVTINTVHIHFVFILSYLGQFLLLLFLGQQKVPELYVVAIKPLEVLGLAIELPRLDLDASEDLALGLSLLVQGLAIRTDEEILLILVLPCDLFIQLGLLDLQLMDPLRFHLRVLFHSPQLLFGVTDVQGICHLLVPPAYLLKLLFQASYLQDPLGLDSLRDGAL